VGERWRVVLMMYCSQPNLEPSPEIWRAAARDECGAVIELVRVFDEAETVGGLRLGRIQAVVERVSGGFERSEIRNLIFLEDDRGCVDKKIAHTRL
jgi:hypothetical protein